MIEVQRSENISVKGGGYSISDMDEVEQPAVVTDLRVKFATFDAPEHRASPTIGDTSPVVDHRKFSSESTDKVLAPSIDATQWSEDENLVPCPICERTFTAKALERHSNICQKVSATKRKVFDIAKTRTKGLEYVPSTSNIPVPRKKSSNKPEDDFQTCPHCSRKFGHKAYDRHVAWCEEKTRRLQTSPTKDMVALAKLHARNSYRPKTPSSSTRKSSGGSSGSPSRKESVSVTPTPSLFNRADSRRSSMSRSNSRNEGVMSMSMSGALGGDLSGLKRTRSLRVSTGDRGRPDISSLNSSDHTVETEDTQFIRAATGRGSIKRGPAPTKASVLRAQAKAAEAARQAKKTSSGHEEHCQLNRMQRAPSVTSQYSGYAGSSYGGYARGQAASPAPSLNLRQRANSPSGRRYGGNYGGSYSFDNGSDSRQMSSSGYGGFGGGGGYGGGNNTTLPQALVKPSVVRPVEKVRGERRDPEGIEHTFPSKSLLHISESTNAGSGGSRGTGSSGTTNATSGLSGSYDHSQEYDPYQSAARQMQELLFGTSFLPASSSTSLSKTAVEEPVSKLSSSSISGTASKYQTPSASTNDDAVAAGETAKTGGGNGGGGSPPSLKPSSNSAFQKYVPANVPSTADIMSRLSGGSSGSAPGTTASAMLYGGNGNSATTSHRNGKVPSHLDSYMNTRRNSGWNNSGGGGAATNGEGKNGGSATTTTAGGAKVARFCHECGNPFALPSIRFCCECGVKRLYC